MTRPASRRQSLKVWLVALASAGAIASLLWSTPAWAGGGDLQVTICGIIADPTNTAVDPKLSKIAPQLQKLLPKHGFKLLDVQSKRLRKGQAVSCDLQGGYTASAVLLDPRDGNGKVRVRCELWLNNTVPQLQTVVATPPNKLFFCDQELSNGQHLLLGVGAR